MKLKKPALFCNGNGVSTSSRKNLEQMNTERTMGPMMNLIASSAQTHTDPALSVSATVGTVSQDCYAHDANAIA